MRNIITAPYLIQLAPIVTRPDCVSGAIHAPPHPPHKVLPYPDRTPPGKPCTDCPNIIWALTDDQDVTLGGWEPMRQTQQLIESKGATLNQWRIHTPICSPSRSELVSGRYFHNIKSDVPVPPPKVLGAATAHVNGTLYMNQSFGVYLREKKGYQVCRNQHNYRLVSQELTTTPHYHYLKLFSSVFLASPTSIHTKDLTVGSQLPIWVWRQLARR